MADRNQKPIAIIATPDDNQMKMIIEICNNCHIESVGVIDVQQLIEHVKKNSFTMLIISDKLSETHIFDLILIIRNLSCEKYLSAIAICTHPPESTEDKIKPLLRVPIDILTYPVNPSILTCKIHLLLTLDNQKKTLQEESQKSARALFAKKAFYHSIGNDIRAPINSIIGMSDLLIGDKLDSEQTKHILNIRRSGEMLLALFNAKIDYANIQAGSLEIESRVFKPIITIQKVVAMLSSFLHSKRTELITKIDPSIPRVLLGDSAHFEQILFNMLFVCIQQTINNLITLHVQVHSKQDDQIKLYVSIEDDSMDLTEIQLATLNDDSITDINNIHVGLFVTKHIVQAMNGNIGFSVKNNNLSELWCTSCFTKTSLTDEKVIMASEINEKNSFSGALLDPENLRILLVEDSPINQLVEKKLLNKLGVTQIEVAENGEEAVNILTNKDFDLVLMDIFMPVMNGLDASRLIRHQNTIRNPNIPIIALSAQKTGALQDDFYNYGINIFLPKPLELESLAISIKKCFPQIKILPSNQSDSETERIEKSVELPVKPKTKEMILFDKKALLERLDGDEALYQELVEGFMADIPVQINKIEKALDFDDLSIAKHLAHTLKGAFSNVGAQLLHKIVQDLEDDIQGKDINMINNNIKQLKHAFNNVKKYI
jgi:CheY-like chemotaxis protein